MFRRFGPISASVLLVVLLVSGCVGQATNSPDRNSGQGNLPAMNLAGNSTTSVRAIAVSGIYQDYATGGAAWCGKLPDCHEYLTFGINFTGTLAGEATGIERDSAPDQAHPDHLNFEKRPVTFTGSIAGCGTGSLGLAIKGYLQPTTQGLLTNETLRYVPGTATTGLSNLVDAFISFDGDPYAWPNPVKLSGTVWCR